MTQANQAWPSGNGEANLHDRLRMFADEGDRQLRHFQPGVDAREPEAADDRRQCRVLPSSGAG